MASGVFSILHDNFFSVLAGANRQHYASLLVLYYRLFQESTHGLERELVIREFMNYLVLHQDTLSDEFEEINEIDESKDDGENFTIKEDSPGVLELEFESSNQRFGEEQPNKKQAPTHNADIREAANRFLRRLVNTGWLGEETLADFTKVINITAWGKPFMKTLADIDGGLKTEYESHVVTVYSMLCGDAIQKDGHHAVLKAHEETRSLIDSLKVLSQSIKGYYDNLNAEAIRAKASSVLNEHYNLYMGEVLDKAYKRLKTSDNVSRYRMGIFKQIKTLLGDEKWLDENAGKYMRLRQTTRAECKEKLIAMLEEIRDELKSVDRLEDEIDRRNAAYSRSSTEIIKAYIEPDSTVAGKIGLIIKEIHNGNKQIQSGIAHGIHRIRFLSPSTLALRQKREEGDFTAVASNADYEALEQKQNEELERMRKRLSIKKIGKWLDEHGGKDRILVPAELINDEESYIRFIYSLLYGDSRGDFGYSIEEDDDPKKSVKADDYIVPDIRLRKKSQNAE